MKRRQFAASIPLAMMGFSRMNKKIELPLSQSVKTPEKLRPGDKIGLIAPAGPVKPEKFDIAIRNMVDLGLEPVYNESSKGTYGYFSANDSERLKDLHTMFADPSIKGIWCLRGGYGCARLLNDIDYKLISRNPKIFIGYSDITALHHAFLNIAGLQTYHGPVASSQSFSAFTLDGIQKVLFQRSQTVEVLPHAQEDEKYRQPIVTLVGGKAEGKLTGGNLSLLSSMAGTAFAPKYEDKLVFIEEVGERPYRIDRMLTQLLQATDIAKARGIIFGTFYDCEAKTEENSFSLIEVLQEFASKINKPSVCGFPTGHVPDMVTLPMDAGATLLADDNVVIYKA